MTEVERQTKRYWTFSVLAGKLERAAEKKEQTAAALRRAAARYRRGSALAFADIVGETAGESAPPPLGTAQHGAPKAGEDGARIGEW